MCNVQKLWMTPHFFCFTVSVLFQICIYHTGNKTTFLKRTWMTTKVNLGSSKKMSTHYIIWIFYYINVTRTEGFCLCILLRRYFYPMWYLDLIPRFGKPVLQLCIITNQVMNLIYDRLHHLLTSFYQPWPSPENLKSWLYADYMHQSEAPLENYWDFIDQTVCRPGKVQRQV